MARTPDGEQNLSRIRGAGIKFDPVF